MKSPNWFEHIQQKQIPAYNELVNELSVIFSYRPRQKE